MHGLDPKIQRLIYYYEDHQINGFSGRNFLWAIAYLIFLFVFFAYILIDFLFLHIHHILSVCISVGIGICALLCYIRLIYLLEKTLGNFSDISFEKRMEKCLYAMFSTRGMLRIAELPSVKQKQMQKIKEEFLDKEKVDSKEKVLAFIEELERKLEYESKRKFFIPFNFSWLLTLFIPIWTILLKDFTERNDSGVQTALLSYMFSLILMSLFVFILIYIMMSFFKTSLQNVLTFYFSSTKHTIQFLISILQEIHLYYCFNERTEEKNGN
ncbi:hypothetical protein ABE236_12310 [Priestia endophytica]|uniref:hypothetical protein n=1 Tax=Priestia endophytica TaxID=135735 RepID=UPI003D2E7BBA